MSSLLAVPEPDNASLSMAMDQNNSSTSGKSCPGEEDTETAEITLVDDDTGRRPSQIAGDVLPSDSDIRESAGSSAGAAQQEERDHVTAASGLSFSQAPRDGPRSRGLPSLRDPLVAGSDEVFLTACDAATDSRFVQQASGRRPWTGETSSRIEATSSGDANAAQSSYGVVRPLPGGPKPNEVLKFMMDLWSQQQIP